jgi:acetylornithine deacetylase/succinyl-diaminopimelate desuccinylase-like protein
MNKTELAQVFDRERNRFLDEWRVLLSFASISADSAYANDCRACAAWLVDHLAAIGFKPQVIPTSSHPLVYAERPGKPGHPVVLFYGHYDVQPVDPLDQWTTPPFAPDLRDGRMFARGAQDNKGQVFATLKALETLIRHDALDCTVKLIIEGDEESGSLVALNMLSAKRDMLRADIVMAADSNMAASGVPTITMGLRGIVTLTATLRGPSHDLHSGMHGGRAPNPATAMARLLATLHDDEGRVAVEGFYDDVREPSREERALAHVPAFDPARYRAETGVDPVGGEQPFTPVERTAFRPALDVNGIHSGYGGQGMKTIIPASALAKISARLVPNQDPERTLAAIERHLRKHVPAGLHLEISDHGIGGPAFRADLKSKAIGTARAVLDEMSHGRTAFLWEGASVPVAAKLPELSGGEPVLVGFGSEEDRIHAPNESYSLEQFQDGFIYTAMFLSRL